MSSDLMFNPGVIWELFWSWEIFILTYEYMQGHDAWIIKEIYDISKDEALL